MGTRREEETDTIANGRKRKRTMSQERSTKQGIRKVRIITITISHRLRRKRRNVSVKESTIRVLIVVVTLVLVLASRALREVGTMSIKDIIIVEVEVVRDITERVKKSILNQM